MDSIVLFLMTAMTAIAVENVVFTRGLGLSKDTMFMKSPRAGILYGAVFTYMAFLCSLFVALINYLMYGNRFNIVLRAPLYLLSVLLVLVGTWEGGRRFLPNLYKTVRPVLPLATFNTALFGVFYLSSFQNFGFVQTIAYALGTGVGFTLALLIVYYARKRLAISPVPRSFRGLPVLLIYIGLFSLAIYGLIGHGLAT